VFTTTVEPHYYGLTWEWTEVTWMDRWSH